MLSVEAGRRAQITKLERSELSFSRGGESAFVLSPERRFYPEREMQTTEASVRSTLIANDYAALGERGADGRWTVRLYRHPLAIWIWLGAAIMALGGVIVVVGRALARSFRARRGQAAPTPRSRRR